MINYVKKYKILYCTILILIILGYLIIQIILSHTLLTKHIYNDLTTKTQLFQHSYQYTTPKQAINENYLKLDKTNERNSFQTVTLVNAKSPELYNVQGKRIPLLQGTFLTTDKSNIDYTNSLMHNNYAFSPLYLKSMLNINTRSLLTKSSYYNSYNEQLLAKSYPLSMLIPKNQKDIYSKHVSNKLTELMALTEPWVGRDKGDLKDITNMQGYIDFTNRSQASGFYVDYPKNVKPDLAEYIHLKRKSIDYTRSKSQFWQQNQQISHSISNNYHYHSNDNYGQTYENSLNDATNKIIGTDDQPKYLKKYRIWSDNYGISKTNKYLLRNEQVFHQECGHGEVTYQQLLNYYTKHGSTLPTVNNQTLENYNAENVLNVAYNVYVHQVALNRYFNPIQKYHISKLDFKMPVSSLVKPNWYMGSQYLFDSYALEPTKSLKDKCLIGTWFNAYVNADNVKAIDNKPIVETKLDGKLYNTNLESYHDKIHSYDSYRIAFLDTKAPIKQDDKGIKYAPIKLGCNYAMPLNKTIQKLSKPHYIIKSYLVDNADDTDTDSAEEGAMYTYSYKRVIDPKWRKQADYYNNQTCYIPLSSLKQIAGKPVK